MADVWNHWGATIANILPLLVFLAIFLLVNPRYKKQMERVDQSVELTLRSVALHE